MNLPPTKQDVCVGYKHVHMQKCQMKAWKHMQTSLCTSGSMDMHNSNKRALGTNRTFCSISGSLHFVYLNICFHQISVTLIKTYKHQYYLTLFNKKIKDFQGPKVDFKYSVLTRPWNQTPEIQGFSRVHKMHTNPGNWFGTSFVTLNWKLL